jgi:RNA polymerase sigma-70 factor, ECF subfamily
LYRFILNRVNDPLLAEDIVQDVLMKAYQGLDLLKDREKILPWLYQITRNTIVDAYRQRRPTADLDESLIVQEMNLDQETRQELACCILPLVKQLPPRYRQAVMWSEIEGLTQQEVALKQGLSLSGAKSRVQRGRKILKTMLLACCHIDFDHRGSMTNYEPQQACGHCSGPVAAG